MIRSKELHNLCEKLRREVPSWKGSIADYWESTTYMNDEDIINELKRNIESHEKLVEFFKTEKNRCGEPTRDEKRIYKILKESDILSDNL